MLRKTKLNIQNEQNKQNKKDKVKNTSRLKKYGITNQEYENILKSQNGVCAICNRPPKTKSLCIDHRHEKDSKGKQIEGDKSLVRGLLCFFCNKYVVGAIEHRTSVKPRNVLIGLIAYFDVYTMKGGD